MKIMKKNLKLIIGIVLGIIMSGATAYAAGLFNSNDVLFDNTNAGLKKVGTNIDVDNVQDAVEAIDNKVNTQLNTCQGNYSTCSSSLSTCQTNLTTAQNNVVTYRDEICPGCVYRKSTTTKYNSNASGADGTNNVLSSSEYTIDYTTLNSNHFLGHVIDANGYILSSYACGINNGTFFCLRGVDSNQSSLTYRPFYQENVNRMNKVFPGCNANTSDSSSCSGGVNAFISPYGTVSVDADGVYCFVHGDGYSLCT